MSTEESVSDPAAGALLLCRAEPDSVAAVAPLLGERMPLVRAGAEWACSSRRGRALAARRRTGRPRAHRLERGPRRRRPVAVLALWWDADRAGYTLASRIPPPRRLRVARGRHPAGEDEANADLRRPSRPGPRPGRPVAGPADEPRTPRSTPVPGCADCSRSSRARESRSPPDSTPADPPTASARPPRALPDARRTEAAGRHPTADESRLAPGCPGWAAPGARALAVAQVAAGLSLTAWGPATPRRRLERGGGAAGRARRARAGVRNGTASVTALGAAARPGGTTSSSSSSSSSRASHVASRSTGTSKSGFRSTKVRSCSASHSKVTSSSPRRFSSSSMPRSVKYMPSRISAGEGPGRTPEEGMRPGPTTLRGGVRRRRRATPRTPHAPAAPARPGAAWRSRRPGTSRADARCDAGARRAGRRRRPPGPGGRSG